MFHLPPGLVEKTRGVRPVRYHHDSSSSMLTKSQSSGVDAHVLDAFDGLGSLFQDENKLPAAPYEDEFYFDLTTFRSTSIALTPSTLLSAIETFLQRAPLVEVRLQMKDTWALHYEFCHLERKNEFSISFFEDMNTGDTQSCLVEMHLSSGNHAPFQKLAEAIRQKFQLTYAFGPKTTTMEPKSKLFDDFDFCLGDRRTVTPKFEANPSELDSVLVHIESPFADVQIQGWDTLAHITNTKAVAKALLKRKIRGRDALTEIQSYVNQSNGFNDQHRLQMKTMKNIMSAVSCC